MRVFVGVAYTSYRYACRCECLLCVCCAISVHVYVYVRVGAHTWRPEENIEYLPLPLCIKPLRQSLLWNLGPPGLQLKRLNNEPQQSCLHPPLSIQLSGDRPMWSHSDISLGAQEPPAGAHAFMTSTVLTEPSLQPDVINSNCACALVLLIILLSSNHTRAPSQMASFYLNL